VLGTLDAEVTYTDDALTIDGKEIKLLSVSISVFRVTLKIGFGMVHFYFKMFLCFPPNFLIN